MASAALIALSIQEGSTVFRVLSVHPLRIIGKYSYGFYIYHMLFAIARVDFLIWCTTIAHSMLIGGLVYALTYYLITLLVAGLSYELYEKRFLAMKSRFHYEPR